MLTALRANAACTRLSRADQRAAAAQPHRRHPAVGPATLPQRLHRPQQRAARHDRARSSCWSYETFDRARDALPLRCPGAAQHPIPAPDASRRYRVSRCIAWTLTTPARSNAGPTASAIIAHVSVQNGVHDEVPVVVRGEVETVDTFGVLPVRRRPAAADVQPADAVHQGRRRDRGTGAAADRAKERRGRDRRPARADVVAAQQRSPTTPD